MQQTLLSLINQTSNLTCSWKISLKVRLLAILWNKVIWHLITFFVRHTHAYMDYFCMGIVSVLKQQTNKKSIWSYCYGEKADSAVYYYEQHNIIQKVDFFHSDFHTNFDKRSAKYLIKIISNLKRMIFSMIYRF